MLMYKIRNNYEVGCICIIYFNVYIIVYKIRIVLNIWRLILYINVVCRREVTISLILIIYYKKKILFG